MHRHSPSTSSYADLTNPAISHPSLLLPYSAPFSRKREATPTTILYQWPLHLTPRTSKLWNKVHLKPKQTATEGSKPPLYRFPCSPRSQDVTARPPYQINPSSSLETRIPPVPSWLLPPLPPMAIVDSLSHMPTQVIHHAALNIPTPRPPI